MGYKCPCCDYYTFGERPNGNYDICPVCFWEDDPSAYDDPDKCCDCNGVSLNKARQNFLDFGACKIAMKAHVRPPYIDEKQGID